VTYGFHFLLVQTDIFLLYEASHLPYNRNGFKFFTSEGGLSKADIKDILQRASSIYEALSDGRVKVSDKDVNASVKKVDYMSIYTSGLVAAVRKAAGNIGICENTSTLVAI
jgi:phosphomannomutase